MGSANKQGPSLIVLLCIAICPFLGLMKTGVQVRSDTSFARSDTTDTTASISKLSQDNGHDHFNPMDRMPIMPFDSSIKIKILHPSDSLYNMPIVGNENRLHFKSKGINVDSLIQQKRRK